VSTLSPTVPLGFTSAMLVVEVGRAAFFDSGQADLPQKRSPQIAEDDLLPQFGYVGAQFTSTRVLLLGINPGNGHGDVESEGDKVMMPKLRAFTRTPGPLAFVATQSTYRSVCEKWPVWGRHCSVLLTQLGLSIDQIAYSNCLPWRTESQSMFANSVAERAATLYVTPLLQELQPSVVVAVGKRAAEIIKLTRMALPPVVTWNRAQALTVAVAREREEAAAELKRLLSGPIRPEPSAL
jgi:hypothetical protein